MKKVVAVGYAHGRVGSSATMSLLRLAGLNVGSDQRLAGPAKMNPKGFLELKKQNIFLKVAFPEVYGSIVSPPDLKSMEEKGKKRAESYRDLLEYEFNDQFPIGLKSPDMLTILFLRNLRDELSTYLIVLDRDTQDQAESLKRVWKQNSGIENTSLKEIRQFLNDWKEFRDAVRNRYDFPVIHVDFNSLINKPYEETLRITQFLSIKCPSEQAVRDWIDPDLVNRRSISEGEGPDFLKKASLKGGRALRRLSDLLISYGSY
jgi:hypothetical protein